MKSVEEYVGQTNFNNHGTLMTIVVYNNCKNVSVVFADEYGCLVKTQYIHFLNGQVSNPYDKTIYGIACIGETTTFDENSKNKIAYNHWYKMIQRCYSDNLHKKRPTYKGCTVCEEWLIFANFEKWFNENFYKVNNEPVHLDKDILIKGNKEYSPETAIFVPKRINTLIVKNDSKRGELPIGITTRKDGKFVASCRDENGKQIIIGSFSTIDDAFEAYKQFKKSVMKKVIQSYKNTIPQKHYQKIYNAILNYEIEITD